MKKSFSFLKTTVIGGALFLIPIIAIIFVIEKAHIISSQMVQPVVKVIPAETLAGIPMPRLLAVLVIVLFCFFAGLFAKTELAGRFVDWLEDTFLSTFPGYSLIKSMSESAVGIEAGKYQSVLVELDDTWQLAFLVEKVGKNHVCVFLPDSPNPLSGSVCFVDTSKIKPLDVPINAAFGCLKRCGRGAGALINEHF